MDSEDDIDMFQYISCCSLSEKRNGSESEVVSFNTSHVVVYRVFN